MYIKGDSLSLSLLDLLDWFASETSSNLLLEGFVGIICFIRLFLSAQDYIVVIIM